MGMEDCRNIFKVWQFFKNIKLPYDPAILLLCIHPRVIKTYVYPKTCIIMFTVEFDISKTKGIRWLQTDGLINKSHAPSGTLTNMNFTNTCHNMDELWKIWCYHHKITHIVSFYLYEMFIITNGDTNITICIWIVFRSEM